MSHPGSAGADGRGPPPARRVQGEVQPALAASGNNITLKITNMKVSDTHRDTTPPGHISILLFLLLLDQRALE